MISLEKTGNAIKFTFDNNGHYLQDGTIEVPVNSLTLVTDESDMFTFKKSATNDIFVSGLYSEIGMSKSELETFYKDNMVDSFINADSAITSGSTNAVQSSAIYDKVTISVEEIETATGSSSDRMVSNEYNYSDGVFSYSADNFSIEEQGLYPWLQYNDGESTKMLMFSAGTVDTDDYSYTLSGNSLYVEFKGANRILEMHFVVVNGQTMTYSYSYVGGQSIQWLKDYVSALEARVKILEQNNT